MEKILINTYLINKKMKLSIVATLYQSALYVQEFHRRVSSAARLVAGNNYEIILVNDGSTDSSLDVAIKLAYVDRHLVVVDLSRNFGHHKAMMTGLSYANGEDVFLIDIDLEEDPELLVSFFEYKQAHKCDVVYGVQEIRRGGFIEKWSGIFFYKIFNNLTDLNLKMNIAVVRLMSRRYVQALLQHKEKELFIAGLWAITGYNQIPLNITKHSSSPTTYSIGKKISQAIIAITSFSSKPLIYIFLVGNVIFFMSILYTGFLVYKWFFLARAVDGYTSIMVSVWVLGGLTLMSLGVVGIYLTKIYSETKGRPYTIVRDVYGGKHLKDLV